MLIGLAAACGHDPREVRDYSLRDLELLEIVAAELYGNQIKED